ncbi:MAG: hypothetical protein M3042_08740 [Actinomycetota bacterium]|nr:hypothetical protein [Actinomycetota bacterium]
MARQERHPEYVEPTWPARSEDDKPVSELAAEHQGAQSPFGSDIALPVPLERHGRHYVVRPPGAERHDTDYGGDEAI